MFYSLNLTSPEISERKTVVTEIISIEFKKSYVCFFLLLLNLFFSKIKNIFSMFYCYECKNLLLFQDRDENGKRGGEVEVPLHAVAKGEVPAGLSNSLHDVV